MFSAIIVSMAAATSSCLRSQTCRSASSKNPPLPAVGENRLQAPAQSYLPDPEKVRRRLNALLETARAAERMPWPERDPRMWQMVFPNMANWLPADEAAQLRLEFAREMERLKQAAPWSPPAAGGCGSEQPE